MTKKEVNKNIEQKYDEPIINNPEENKKNTEADKLANTVGALVFYIPMVICFANLIKPPFLSDKLLTILISQVMPLSILAGLTLLVYIRIRYPNNSKSKKLILICIIVFILIVVFIVAIYSTCANLVSLCKGMPG